MHLGVPCYQINFLESINTEEYDIIHTTMAKPDLYGLIHRHKIKSKWVISAHNYILEDTAFNYNKLKALLISKIWLLCFKRSENIVVSSYQMLNYYQRIVGQRNFKVIPYGITKKDLSPVDSTDDIFLRGLSKKFKVIGSVGLLIKRKGFHQLIRFLVLNKNYAVVIIGDGEERENLLSLAKEKGVENRFFLLGFRNNSIDYCSYFDIYAMTSYSEGFGLALLEAMSHGIPVVCSKLDIYNDYFSEGDVSFFELDNIESLSDAFKKIGTNRASFSDAAKNLFERSFSSLVMAAEHVKFYKNIIYKNK